MNFMMDPESEIVNISRTCSKNNNFAARPAGGPGYNIPNIDDIPNVPNVAQSSSCLHNFVINIVFKIKFVNLIFILFKVRLSNFVFKFVSPFLFSQICLSIVFSNLLSRKCPQICFPNLFCNSFSKGVSQMCFPNFPNSVINIFCHNNW